MKTRAIRTRVLLSASALMASAIWVSYILDSTTLADGPRLALVLIPPAIAIWMITVYVRLVRRADEFQRKVLLESLAIAFPIALLLGMTVEYLQKGGFLMGIDVGRLWPAQGIVWAIALVYAHWRYR